MTQQDAACRIKLCYCGLINSFFGVIFGLLWVNTKNTSMNPDDIVLSLNKEIHSTVRFLVVIFIQLQTLIKQHHIYVVEHRCVESCDIFIVKRGHSTMFWPWEGGHRGHVLSMRGASKRTLSLFRVSCFFKHHSGWIIGVAKTYITLKDLDSRWSPKFVFWYV